MKFEEALAALRLGAKIHHPHMPEDEYYMACRISLRPEFIINEIDAPLPPPVELPMSIVWMRGDKEHPDMRYKWNPYDPKTDPCKHGMAPMINLLWLMSEEWKILGEIK
jgi:hypothetical protein